MEEKCKEEFEKIYEIVSSNCKDTIKQENKLVLMNSLIISVVVMVIFTILTIKGGFTRGYFSRLLVIAVLVYILAFMYLREGYKRKFKEVVVKEIIKNYNETFKYSPKAGIDSKVYRRSKLNTEYNRFFGDDLIMGSLRCNLPVMMSEIVTQVETQHLDDQGNPYTTMDETFRGAFVQVELKKIFNDDIFLKQDSKFRKFSGARVEAESQQFEKYFDILSKDRIVALRIFTADIIEKLENLRKDNKLFEISIVDNKLYVKYYLGALFELPQLGDGLDKANLYKYFKSLYYPMELVEILGEAINDLVLD